MTHAKVQKLLFSSLLLLPLVTQVQAQSVVRLHWPDLCRATTGKQLVITTIEDNHLEGHCVSVDDDEVRLLSATSSVIRVTRASVSRIETQPRHSRQLVSLRKGINGALTQEMKLIFSPHAPVGIAAVPVTVAWGIVATPFCLIADIAHGNERNEEIQLF